MRLLVVGVMILASVLGAAPAYAADWPGGLDRFTPGTAAYITEQARLLDVEAAFNWQVYGNPAGKSISELTVSEVAGATGATPAQVIKSVIRSKAGAAGQGLTGVLDGLPDSGGVRTVGANAAAALACVGVSWLQDEALGTSYWVDSSGATYAMGSTEYWTATLQGVELFGAKTDGWLWDAVLPEGMDWLDPAYVYEQVNSDQYTFTTARTVTEAQTEFIASYEWVLPPYTISGVGWTGGLWDADWTTMHQTLISRNDDPTWPFRLVLTTSSDWGTPQLVDLTSQGVAPYSPFYYRGASLSGSLAPNGTVATNPYDDAYNQARGDGWLAFMDDVLSSARVSSTTTSVTVPGSSIPYPEVTPFVASVAAPGISPSSTIAEVVEAVEFPSTLPESAVDPLAVSPGAVETVVAVTVPIQELRLVASTRFPFSFVEVLAGFADPGVCTPDSMEWELVLTPPLMLDSFLGKIETKVAIAPLDWIEPIKPFRWVLAAAVWFGGLAALWELLRPKVNV